MVLLAAIDFLFYGGFTAGVIARNPSEKDDVAIWVVGCSSFFCSETCVLFQILHSGRVASLW